MRTPLFAATLALAATAALADSGSAASETLLLKQALQGMEGKEANVVRVDIPAGWETPRHMHPGNVIVYVLEGAIEIDQEGREKQTARAGEVVYEVPGSPMVGRNLSATEEARLLVVYIGDEGQPLTVPHEE